MLANFTKASLIVPETQIVARLLLEGLDDAQWRTQIEQQNVLQSRSLNTAKSYASIARMRLETMDEPMWELVAESGRPVATQAVLACALNFSPLLAAFMRTALSDEYRRMSPSLEDRIWDTFFSDMALQHHNLAQVSAGTQAKLRQNAYRILTEAEYLGKARSRPLQHVRVVPAVRHYLSNHNYTSILAAMECSQ